jgi:hypothetical protein
MRELQAFLHPIGSAHARQPQLDLSSFPVNGAGIHNLDSEL